MSYLSSETMREFHREAVKRGWAKSLDDTVREYESSKSISKVASDEKGFIGSSGDIFADVCVLSEMLRDKGYLKQAELLEKKALDYKIASTDFYKVHNYGVEQLLDLAHPEGDVEIADASEDYGLVETDTSSQKKIIDRIRKKKVKSSLKRSNILKSADDRFSNNIASLRSDIAQQIPEAISKIDRGSITYGSKRINKDLLYSIEKHYPKLYASIVDINRFLKDTWYKIKGFNISKYINPTDFFKQLSSLGIPSIDLASEMDSVKNPSLLSGGSEQVNLYSKISDRIFKRADEIAESVRNHVSHTFKNYLDSLESVSNKGDFIKLSQNGETARFLELFKSLVSETVYSLVIDKIKGLADLSFSNKVSATIGRINSSIDKIKSIVSSGRSTEQEYQPLLSALLSIRKALSDNIGNDWDSIANHPGLKGRIDVSSFEELDRETIIIDEHLKKVSGGAK